MTRKIVKRSTFFVRTIKLVGFAKSILQYFLQFLQNLQFLQSSFKFSTSPAGRWFELRRLPFWLLKIDRSAIYWMIIFGAKRLV